MRPSDLQDTGPSKISPMDLGLVEQPTRPRSEYTMAAWREAKEAADNGVLRQAADLTRAAMTEDGYARGVLGTLTEGLWGLPMNFLGDPRMIDALTDTPSGAGQWREMFPQPEAIRLMSWGINLGVGVGQMRHKWREPGEQAVSVEDAASGEFRIVRPLRPIGAHATRVLRTWDSKWLRHQWWDDTWWLMTADREIRITPGDGEWILYTPYGTQKPWEWGAWMALCLAFVLARDAMFDQSRHAEVLAPVRVGKVPQGTTQRQRKEYLRQIREMQRMAAFVLPPGLDYSIVESTGRINDIYKQIIERSERQYCLIYTGNETTTKGTSGFSQGDVQERIASSKLKSFSGSLSICLRDGGLREWAIENYGTADAPLALFDCEPPEDKLAKAKTVSEAGDSLGKINAGLATAGLRVTKASATAYAQSFGFAVEDLPVATAPAPEAESPVAQGDLAKALRADEIRALAGIPAFGDERGDMVLSALNAPPAPPGGAPFAAEPGALAPLAPLVPPVATVAESEDAPDTSAAAALAAKMTLHGVPRCEHERPNRCLMCGVERTRDFDAGVGPDGGHVWRVAWRPIGGTVAPVAEPAVASIVAGYNPDQSRADDGTFGEGAGVHGGGTKPDHGGARSKAHANALEEHGNEAAREQRRAYQLTPKLAKAKDRRDAAAAAFDKEVDDESAYDAHEAAKKAHEEAPTKATAATLKKASKDLKESQRKFEATQRERDATQEHYELLKERTAVAQSRAVASTQHADLLKLPHDEYVSAVRDHAQKADFAERSAKANVDWGRSELDALEKAYDPSKDGGPSYKDVEKATFREKDAAARHEAAAAADAMWRGYAEDAKDFDTRYGDGNYEVRASRQLAAGYNPDQERAEDGKFGAGGGSAKGDAHVKRDRVESAHDAHEDASAEVEESAARMAAAKEASAKNAAAHKEAEAKHEKAEADHGAAEEKLEKAEHVHSLLVKSEADPDDVKDAADRVANARKDVAAAESTLASAEEARDAAQDAIDDEESYGPEEHDAAVTAAYHAKTELTDAKIDADAGTPEERHAAYDAQHEKSQREYIANAKAHREAVAEHAAAETAYASARKDDDKEPAANAALADAEVKLSLATSARDRSRQRRDHWVTRASSVSESRSGDK